MPAPTPSCTEVSWSEFLAVWLRVAALSFGGPAGQIAVMHRILVDEKQWVDERRFLHALNYCMLLPGPEAQQLAIYIGWLMRGMLGGLLAGLLFVLPGFLSILALSVVYALYQETPLVQAIFFGLQAAILAVVVEAVVRIGRRVLKNRVMVAIAVAAFMAVFFLRIPFPYLLLVVGLLGLVGGRIRPDLFHVLRGHAGASEPGDAAAPRVIHYDAPHTRPNVLRAATIFFVFITLWITPLVAMQLRLGEKHVFTQQGWFFSKVSLVTFGGAYAVLPYVARQSEETYGWVDGKEMMAGLGMAETTPGPLIQVVQFVGFLGAYKQHGDLHPVVAGLIGSLIVNWVTYLPCFLWIFLGAPYIERLRGNLLLSSALSAITAAVVGVVLNLAVWFTLKALFHSLVTYQYGPLHVYWPEAFTSGGTPLDFSWGTLVLAIAAAVALFRYKRGILEVLAVSVLIGAILYGLGVR
jgi:chromate transporter